MKKSDAKTRIAELRELLASATKSYYEEGLSILEDRDFDEKLAELEALEGEFPELRSEDSPTRKVGIDLTEGFRKIRHKIPMLSIANSYSLEDLQDFCSQVERILDRKDIVYTVEKKIDGVSLALIYENGRLKHAITRGDGQTGDEVTANARTIANIPETLPPTAVAVSNGRFEVRGEVYMRHDRFAKLNRNLEKKGNALLQNPRNATAGSLKLKDPAATGRRQLSFLAYAITDGSPEKSHISNLSLLAKLGFEANEGEICSLPEEIFSACNRMDSKRSELPYDIDGMVIKVDELALQSRLGNTAKSPRWIMAWKFATEKAESKVLSVDIQVGRTGAVTPVANLEPVRLGGTTVKRATLHNFEEVERLDLHIGDTVLVEKGGEIIPKILQVLPEKRQGDVKAVPAPSDCPVCGSPLVQPEKEVVLRCENLHCSAQVQRLLEHFVSRQAMNIEHMGPSLIAQLIDQKSLHSPEDFYKLSFDKLSALERMADKSAQNVLAAIEKSKNRGLDCLLHGLGIRHVGRGAAKNLARNFGDIDHLMVATEEDLQAVHEVGWRIAESVLDFFSRSENRQVVEDLREAGVLLNYEGERGGILEGKVFVLTGTLPNMGREEARTLIEKAGGKVSSSISRKTNYLLAGAKAGSKLKKAEALEVEVLDEEGLLAMVDRK